MADYKFAFYLILALLMLVILRYSDADSAGSRPRPRSLSQLDSMVDADEQKGTTNWAVLVAGSYGFGNYRHQADVCHAYQILKKGGLKDENIVVFMYDDIAYNEYNPRKGVIINNPKGHDVYAGVPKDYTGDNLTQENLFAVILGDKSSVKGGSGKVVDSGPNDRIFIYYTDHGGPGILGMPQRLLYANDFIDVLKKKHKAGTYKEMVIYVEACESGSIFEGLLPDDINIYVQTASNAHENSYATYCPENPKDPPPTKDPPPPKEYITCLGDLFSVSWMEDSDTHDLKLETIKEQYLKVKKRTSNVSHVMEYGTQKIHNEKVSLYQGFKHASKDHQAISNTRMVAIDQREVDIHSLWARYKSSPNNINKKMEILKQIKETMKQRSHLDNSISMMGKVLFEPAKANSILNTVREPGLPIVDDWDCLKSMVGVFETHCGPLTEYGMKHMRAFANICNNGVTSFEMEHACISVCGKEST